MASARPVAQTSFGATPIAVALLAVLALVATIALDGPAVAVGAWMAVAVGSSAAALGTAHGAAFAGLGLLAAWAVHALGGRAPGPGELAELGVVALIALAAGGWTRARIVASRASAEAERRRGRMLAEATLELLTAEDADGALAALPVLVAHALDAHHASTLRLTDTGASLVATVPPLLPPGTQVPERSIVVRAGRTNQVQHLPDARLDPDYYPIEGLPADVAELAIPLRVGDGVRAVLNVERGRAEGFDDDDRAMLQALTRVVELNLDRFETLRVLERERHAADRLADLAHRLAQVESAEAAANATLAALQDTLTIDGGVVFHAVGGQFRPLALGDGLPASARQSLAGNLSWGRGQLYQVWRSGESRFDSDYAVGGTDAEYRALGLRALATVPVLDTSGDTTALIAVGSFSEAHDWSDDERRLLASVAATLGAVLSRIASHAREAELLWMVRQLADAADPSELYQRVVEAAVRIVPGAEAGTLVVRTPDGAFAFQGVVGFDREALTATLVTEASQLAWYGRPERDWLAGRPRLLAGDEVARTSAETASGTATADAFFEAGRVWEIRATLCVPVVLQQEVLAVLNLDAFSHDEAFGAQSIATAQALAYHVAVIVRQAQDRAALVRSALTDPLTGLGNREAFNRALARELTRARRHGEPAALAMLDLDGFKRINDELGHAAGDVALAEVAEVLRGAVRGSDEVFRWGGDEFAVIMPMLEPQAAAAAAGRIVAAIAALDVHGFPLGASVGMANYPLDGADAEALLRRADDLMYEIKGSRPTPKPA